MMKKVPFNQPYVDKKLILSFKKFKNFSSEGYYSSKCKNFIKKKFKFKDIFLTKSCTAALEVCALLLNLKRGDEVIVQSYSFVSTANAFAMFGARIKFIDIDNNTLNAKFEDIKKSISNKTKAVVLVNYAGSISPDIIKIKNYLKKKRLF